MSEIIWPDLLPDLPLRQGYKAGLGENRVRTPMDTGPKKSRRRSTKRVDLVTLVLHMTSAQLQVFLQFYEDTGDGTLPFEYIRIETGETVDYEFGDDPPTWVPARSPGYWDVTLNLETV